MTSTIDTQPTATPAPLLTGAASPTHDLSPVEQKLVALRPFLVPLFEDERHLAAFEVAVYQAAIREPDLHLASSASLSDAIMGCARLGLLPEGIEGHAVLTVRRNVATGELRAECIVMVNGLCHLAIRDGSAVEIIAETIREGEDYKYRPTEKVLEHDVQFPRNKTIVAAYACIELKSGRRLYEVVDQADLEAAESASRGNIAWRIWTGQMAKKTAKRRAVFANGLLAPTTTAALSGVRVEFDELIGRPAELGKAPGTAATDAPKGEASSAGAGAAAGAEGAKPSTTASKLLDKIKGDRAQREAASGAGAGFGAGPHKRADTEPAPATTATTTSKPAASASKAAVAKGKSLPGPGKKSPTTTKKAAAKKGAGRG